MRKLPVAIQLFSVRNEAEKDFRGTMAAIKEMGYDGVELAGLYGKTPAEIKAILDEMGLQLVSAHVPVADLVQDEMLDAYASMGLKFIVIPWMSLVPEEAAVNEAIETIRGIAVRVRERGMQLLYHNHDFEFAKVNGAYILDTFYASVSPELLQTEIDTCWANVGGENPAAFLRKYTGRSPIVHLKDFVGQKTENMYALIGNSAQKEEATQAFDFRPVGYGVQDIPAIVDAAVEIGAKWLVVEQDRPALDKTALECAKMSIDYLNTVL